MSSPYLNNTIIIGCLLTYTSVILLGLDSHLTSESALPVICTARIWTLMAGFTLAFGSMFSKTWRVHSIFTDVKLNKKVKQTYLTDVHAKSIQMMCTVRHCMYSNICLSSSSFRGTAFIISFLRIAYLVTRSTDATTSVFCFIASYNCIIIPLVFVLCTQTHTTGY